MRNSSLREIFGFLSALICLCSCLPKPYKTFYEGDLDLNHPSPHGIWFTTHNGATGGDLGRIQLKDGKVNHHVKPVRLDTQLFTDFGPENNLQDPKGLFLIMKGGNDSVAVTQGQHGEVVGHAFLESGFLTQFATRDQNGNVWISGHNSNSIQIFNSNLSQKRGSIDLSKMVKNTPMKFASLAQMIPYGSDRMIVTGQRHQRRPSAWRPNKQAGFAVLNVHTLETELVTAIEGPNPIRLSSVDSEVVLVASGDFSPQKGLTAQLKRFVLTDESTPIIKESKVLPYVILDAHITSLDEPPALIAWYRDSDTSCLQIGDQAVYCEEGKFQFSKVLLVENELFMTRSQPGSAEIWAIQFDLQASPVVQRIQKLYTSAPVISIALGP